MNKLFNTDKSIPYFSLFLVLSLIQQPLHAFDEVLKIESPAGTYTAFGRLVIGHIDVTGDGYNDVIVASHYDGQGGNEAGKVQAFSGSTGTLIWESIGNAAEGWFGYALDEAGDYNADGIEDILVGEPNCYEEHGRVHVLSGASGDILVSFENSNSKVSGRYGEMFGAKLAHLGDANDDQKPDYLIGMPQHRTESGHFGAVALISGADGSELYRLESDKNAPHLGSSITELGDLDGDRFPDFALASSGLRQAGRVHVYSGKTGTPLYTVNRNENGGYALFGQTLAKVGDTDGDRINDFVVGAPHIGRVALCSGVDGAILFEVSAKREYAKLGTGVSGVGDVNGDGINDFAASATKRKDVDAGSVMIYSGLDASVLKVIASEEFFDTVGTSLAYAGKSLSHGDPALVIGPGEAYRNRSVSVHRKVGHDLVSYMIRHADGRLSMRRVSKKDAHDKDEDE